MVTSKGTATQTHRYTLSHRHTHGDTHSWCRYFGYSFHRLSCRHEDVNCCCRWVNGKWEREKMGRARLSASVLFFCFCTKSDGRWSANKHKRPNRAVTQPQQQNRAEWAPAINGRWRRRRIRRGARRRRRGRSGRKSLKRHTVEWEEARKVSLSQWNPKQKTCYLIFFPSTVRVDVHLWGCYHPKVIYMEIVELCGHSSNCLWDFFGKCCFNFFLIKLQKKELYEPLWELFKLVRQQHKATK